MSPENKAHFLVEKEAIHLILTGIGHEIYSTVDACQTAQELWEANERLQQECKTILAETSKSLWESISVRDSCLVALQTKQTEFEKYKAVNDRTIDYEKLKHDSNAIPDSPVMCEDDIQNDQNDVESDDKRVALANLIANLKLDV
nr:hypothetical protein [Tanacetum cinerariifolium]